MAVQREEEREALRKCQSDSFDLLEQSVMMHEFEARTRDLVHSLQEDQQRISARKGGHLLPRLGVFGSVFSLFPRPP